MKMTFAPAVSAVAVWRALQATVWTLKAPGFITPAVPQLTNATALLAQHPVEQPPHWLATPAPPHIWPLAHVPQLSVPPQPSGTEPQLSPRAAHVVGVQAHWLGTPAPPHVWPWAHVPQLSVPPQPSGTEPQLSPRAAHVVGLQAHWLGVPPAPQVWPPGQAPQSSMLR